MPSESGRTAHFTARLVALAAVDGTPLGGLERDGGFLPALRAYRSRFRPRGVPGRSSRPTGRLAVLASLRFVPEALICEERLLPCCEHEFRATFNAFQGPILILHWIAPNGPVLGSSAYGKGAGFVPAPSPVSLLSPCAYSCSRRIFLRMRLRERAAFARRFSPGFM